MAYKFPEKIYPNSINTYIQCPFKFKCYADKDVKAEFIENAESYVGKVMHLVLKDFFDISKTPIAERKNQDLGKMLRTTWARMPKTDWGNEVWTAEERAVLFGSKEQERAYGLQAVAMLQNYVLSADLSVVPLSLEDWLDCDLGEFKIAGRIDRIDQDSENSISVWDYKTGKLPFHDSIEKKIKEDLQVPIYAIIASKLYPFAEKIRSGLIYIKYSKIYDIIWNKKDIEKLEADVSATIKKASEEKEFLPRVNKLCPWCEYMKACPAKDSIATKSEKVDEVEW